VVAQAGRRAGIVGQRHASIYYRVLKTVTVKKTEEQSDTYQGPPSPASVPT
jgi:hypothetical protein